MPMSFMTVKKTRSAARIKSRSLKLYFERSANLNARSTFSIVRRVGLLEFESGPDSLCRGLCIGVE